MITLLLVSGFFLTLCVAAAGLIASAQNELDGQRAMLSDVTSPEMRS